MFNGAKVLILEDEPLIAMDLSATVVAAGGRVVGPAGTIAAALALLEEERVAAAILDANLPDGELTPVAIQLIERGVSVIVHTGVGVPDALRERYPDVPVCLKPISPDRVVEALSGLMKSEERLATVADEH